jgi:hypothetical protein
MTTKTSPVNQKTNFNVYLGNCQQDPDVKMLLARQILGLYLPKDDCQFMESVNINMERLRKSLEGKARQCVKMVLFYEGTMEIQMLF